MSTCNKSTTIQVAHRTTVDIVAEVTKKLKKVITDKETNVTVYETKHESKRLS